MFPAALPQSLYGLLPGVLSGSLNDKTGQGSPDTYSATRPVRYRKLEPTRDEQLRGQFIITDIVSAFQIINDGTDAGFLPPQAEGRFTDSAGERWLIRMVSDRIMNTLHRIVCTKNW